MKSLLLVDGVTKLQHLHLTDNIKKSEGQECRPSGDAGGESAQDVSCDGERYPCHYDQTGGSSAQYAYLKKYQSKEAQQRIARETQEIYRPIAQRLGISKIKIELEDLSLKYLEPEAYYDLVEKVALRKKCAGCLCTGTGCRCAQGN